MILKKGIHSILSDKKDFVFIDGKKFSVEDYRDARYYLHQKIKLKGSITIYLREESDFCQVLFVGRNYDR